MTRMWRINGLVLALLCFKIGIASPNPQPGLQLGVEVKTVSPFVTSDEIHGGGGGDCGHGDCPPCCAHGCNCLGCIHCRKASTAKVVPGQTGSSNGDIFKTRYICPSCCLQRPFGCLLAACVDPRFCPKANITDKAKVVPGQTGSSEGDILSLRTKPICPSCCANGCKLAACVDPRYCPKASITSKAKIVPGHNDDSAKGQEIGINEEEEKLGHDDCVDGSVVATKVCCSPGEKCNTCTCQSKDTRKLISFKCECGSKNCSKCI